MPRQYVSQQYITDTLQHAALYAMQLFSSIHSLKQKLQQACTEITASLYRNYSKPVPKLQRACTEITASLYRNYSEPVPKLQQACTETLCSIPKALAYLCVAGGGRREGSSGGNTSKIFDLIIGVFFFWVLN